MDDMDEIADKLIGSRNSFSAWLRLEFYPMRHAEAKQATNKYLYRRWLIKTFYGDEVALNKYQERLSQIESRWDALMRKRKKYNNN